MGETAVVDIDHVGRFVGTVVRMIDGGFVVKFAGYSRAAQAIAKLVERAHAPRAHFSHGSG